MAGDKIDFLGTVIKAMGNGNFRVAIDEMEAPLHCVLSGRIRKHAIRVVEGDSVKVEVSPYDLSRGTIVFRMKG